jgi:hypothetical protein
MGFFYLILTTVSSVIYAYYFARGQTPTTVLPCLSATWYWLYMLAIMGLMLTLIVVASIETNKPVDGYTSGNPDHELGCALSGWSRPWWFDPQSGISMFASDVDLDGVPSLPVQAFRNDNTSVAMNFWLYNFTGFCVGHMEGLRW